jgi:hypothetical protein
MTTPQAASRTIVRALAVLALAGGASLAPALALPLPPVMEGIDAVAVAESMRINGVPTRARVFSTRKPLAEVLAFYRRQFGEKCVETSLQGWTVVTGRENDLLYTARLRKSLLGTEGTISVADLKEGLANHGRPLGFGVPAGSRLAVDVEMTDPGKRGRVVTLTNEQSVDANGDFFKAELRSRGFRVERDQPVASGQTRGRSIWFAAPSREAILVVSSTATGASVVLQLTEATETER